MSRVDRYVAGLELLGHPVTPLPRRPRADASGFLKDVPAADLERAVRTVAAGDAALSPRVAGLLMRHVAAAAVTRPSLAGPGLQALTVRESEVLRLLARGLTNAEVAAALVLSEATVKSHVSRVLLKLGLRDRVQTVVTAYGAGLVTPGETPDPRSGA